MREIYFRGKTPKGEWVCGDLLRFMYLDKHIIWQSNSGNAVIPETVGQFTGLTDKNGKWIFEGDIVDERPPMNKHGFRGFVAWDEDRGLWRLVFKDNPEYLAVLGTYSNSYKVIGNIHDNPELLGGGADNGE
jgi:uncharacterized phage protein (TIGR01671 family)